MGPERSLLGTFKLGTETCPEITLCVTFRDRMDFTVCKEPT
jgi:hypothetical protein